MASFDFLFQILSSSNDEGNLENVISESYEEPVSRNIKGDRIEESKGKQLAVQSKAIFEDADTSDEEVCYKGNSEGMKQLHRGTEHVI